MTDRKPRLKSIEEEWQGFSSMIFRGCNPPPNQLAEMRKAFYAGAFTVIVACGLIGTPGVSEEEGVAYFEDRRREVEAFIRNLIQQFDAQVDQHGSTN